MSGLQTAPTSDPDTFDVVSKFEDGRVAVGDTFGVDADAARPPGPPHVVVLGEVLHLSPPIAEARLDVGQTRCYGV
ncbi:hypothetical protein [Streptomyces sp.]|uniref:hypothetical protein n=1 Tax=Streptomyces sp. TaxID=1931 RepID=UPI002D774E44|nr:hypothetical protein [Streptomyces sp.]HET6354695.1 hypothetical protein [Streptomyces sp.]